MTKEDGQTLDQAEKNALAKLATELGKEMQAFMIELVNTVYGFELSDSFLKRMMSLMELFNAHLCVDEVMTAGRTSDKFLLSDKMGIKADYISLGKFMTQGVVLERRGINPSDPTRGRVGGISLGTSLVRMAEVLQEVKSFDAGTIERARSGMISHLKAIKRQPGEPLHEVVVWGKGAMVYCNIICDRNGVLIGRYLPLLGSPAPPIVTSKSMMWHARDQKNEKISPQMSKEYRRAMVRMWTECNKVLPR
jgi:4-aminobutyrate aminotransferase-like enzyme